MPLAYYGTILDNYAYGRDRAWRMVDVNGFSSREQKDAMLSRYGVCCPNAKGYRDYTMKQVSDLVKMYDKFIDPSLRPEWLPISQSTTTCHVSISSPSSDLARQHRATLRKRKNGKKDSKESAHNIPF